MLFLLNQQHQSTEGNGDETGTGIKALAKW